MSKNYSALPVSNISMCSCLLILCQHCFGNITTLTSTAAWSVCNQIPACEQDWHLQLDFESLDCICGENVANKCWHFIYNRLCFLSSLYLRWAGWACMPFLSNTLVHIHSLTESHPQCSSTGPAHGHLCGSSSHFHLPDCFSNWFIMSSTILWLTAPADLPLGYRLMSFAHIFMPTSPHLLLHHSGSCQSNTQVFVRSIIMS